MNAVLRLHKAVISVFVFLGCLGLGVCQKVSNEKMQATNKTSNHDIIGGQLFPVHGVPFCDAILGSG